jgi:hypothetical protein
MQLTEYASDTNYLVARNNMLQDTTVTAGAIATNALVEMPQIVEIGIWAVAAAFAISALRFAAHKHSINQGLKAAGE